MRRSLLLVSLFFVAASALAQQAAPPKITWIRHYQVERGREAAFMRLMRESTALFLEPMVASKAIAAWGVAVPVTHDTETWTHLVFVALPDWGAVERVVQALDGAPLTPAQAKDLVPLASSILGVRDVVIRHLVQGGTAAAKPKFIAVDTYVIKPGRGGDAVALFNEWPKPIFMTEAVAAKVPVWGLSVQDLQTSEPWTHMVWAFESDLGAHDAFDAATMAMDPRKLQGFDVRLRDMSEIDKHRAQILRIVLP